ncbi:hypothetical protein [Tumebacillus flagellatus]|uniref:Uncharacterized protein n=1 Tax=Tumebacillus flagellatus TaxID=1157490 RepID=A0A074LI64_9BACL|nr:hypothetical protein [Tumebacillus flagellatus]KEO80834.1 hypothetical protein EL26_24150 [Tumebacillus flagellatus]
MDLSQHAMRYVGQPIVAHHVNGTVHRGILHSVTPQGMYIRYGAGYASTDEVETRFTHLDLQNMGQDAEEVFFGLGFLPWLGLAGFWGGGLWW